MPLSLRFVPSQTSVRAGLFSRIHRLSPGLRLAVLVAALAAIAVPNHARAAIQVQPNTEGNTGGSCSLQEAIYATEFGQAVALGQTDPDNAYATGCSDPAGTWNEIDLPGGTLTFTKSWDGDAHNPFGPTATPIIFATITIHGHGTTLQWNGPELFRLFAIGYASITFGAQGGALTSGTFSGTGNLTLQDVDVKGFQAKGGDGAGVGFCCLGGGGGGLGTGGAIYVGEIPGAPGVPVLTVQNSTFEGNGAIGGNGGGGVTSGGGGVGGNGEDRGGGGGSRGKGGYLCANYPSCASGGGGGGTVFDGSPDGPGGYLCGGSGGSSSHHDGHDATCPGGGGGGAYLDADDGNGGNGAFGGGGGGVSATKGNQNGGNGGFGGGGGGGWGNGGGGGFGGGGGAGFGHGGAFGGNASDIGAGGGGALGGAIFNDSGTVVVQNSTFYNNSVTRGLANCPNCDQAADNGGDSGGAIFSRNGSLTVQNATISGNQATGAGGGIVVYNDGSTTTFILQNTIVANNGAQECIMEGLGAVTTSSGGVGSSTNLIVNNSPTNTSPPQHPCPQGTLTSDPLLDSVPKPNSGDTPTLALKAGSPAVDAGDDTYILATDQRGVPRPVGAHGDIGAYERIPQADFSITKAVGNDTAKAGDTVTYTLTVTDDGDAATSVTVTDNFPAALTFVSCSAPGGSCAMQGAAVVATYSTFPANSSQTITITGTLKSGFARGTIISNDASVQASSPTDPDTTNNSASVSFTVIVPDFTITAVTPLNILVASNTDSKVTIGSIDTFSSPVNLTATGPAGFHETFSVNPVTPPSNGSANSNMNVRLEPSVTVGTYTVTATGTSGSLSHSFDVTVNVVTSLPSMMGVVNGDLSLGCIDNSGIGGALNAKLSAALNALNGGQTQTEVNTLQALLNQINAQAGKHIKTACVDGSGSTFNPAATLISDVNNLLSNAGASPKDPIMGNVVNTSAAGVPGVAVSLLTSKNATVATVTTDAMGYYYFPATSGLTSGASYNVKVTVPKAYRNASPSSQSLTWKSAAVSLSNFVLN